MSWVYRSASLLLLFFLSIQIHNAQNRPTDERNLETLKQFLLEIDDEQLRIEAVSNIATPAFNSTIDEIQNILARKSDDPLFFSMLAFEILSDLKSLEIHDIQKHTKTLIFLKNCLQASEVHNKGLKKYILDNPVKAIEHIRYLSFFQGIETILLSYAEVYPDEIISHYEELKNKACRLKVLDKLVQTTPSTIKDYLGSQHMIKKDFLKLTSAHAISVKKIYLNDPNNNRMYAFTDEISSGEMTIQEAGVICNNDKEYFIKLTEVFLQEENMSRHSLNEALRHESLKIARVLNNEHQNKDFDERFKSVMNLNAKELYTLIILSEEEVFTSTFNGLYSILLKKLGNDRPRFLESVNHKEFRTFLRLLASYSKLEDWLSIFNEMEQTKLLKKFVKDLEEFSTLDEAITVADALGSIQEGNRKEVLRMEIQSEFARCRYLKHERGIAIYRILKSLASTNDMKSIPEHLDIAPPDVLQRSRLFNDGLHIQQHLFYDDDDGIESYASFMSQFNQSQWEIRDHGTYIIIAPARNPNIRLFVNKPEFEKEGQRDIHEFFTEEGIDPQVIVHRGHSFHTSQTLKHINSSTQLAVIGSCGSYHRMYEVIERAPEIHIISTKQIGSQHVNNPLILMLIKAMIIERDLDWNLFWEAMEVTLRDDDYAAEKFADYIPPHKNLGILFVKAFKKSQLN